MTPRAVAACSKLGRAPAVHRHEHRLARVQASRGRQRQQQPTCGKAVKPTQGHCRTPRAVAACKSVATCATTALAPLRCPPGCCWLQVCCLSLTLSSGARDVWPCLTGACAFALLGQCYQEM